MKQYTVVEVRPTWISKNLASAVESEINDRVKEGYELVNIGFSVDSDNKPIAIITFSK